MLTLLLFFFLPLFYVPRELPVVGGPLDKLASAILKMDRSDNETEEMSKRVSRLLDQLVESHDRRVRPNYGGPPVIVDVSAHIIGVSRLSELSMDYTLDLYLRQFWLDERLAFHRQSDTAESLTIGIDMVNSIWTPDTFFPNEKSAAFHDATTHNSFLRIDSHGNVLRSIRLTVTANCPMWLHSFPLDVQQCPLEIESYGYSTLDIEYHWRKAGKSPLTVEKSLLLGHFTLGDHTHSERVISLRTGNYSRLSASFTFRRNLGFYLIQVYFPSSLVVVVSWLSFWLSRDATQARVTIGVTTVLTMTTLMTSTNGSLPKVAYIKSLDIYLGVCFFLVFASLVEYAAVGYLLKKSRDGAFSPKIPSSKIGKPVLRVVQQNNTPPPSSDFLQCRNRGRPEIRTDPIRRIAHHDRNFCSPPRLVPIQITALNRGFRPSQVDMVSRIAFPLAFFLFQIIYWWAYLVE